MMSWGFLSEVKWVSLGVGMIKIHHLYVSNCKIIKDSLSKNIARTDDFVRLKTRTKYPLIPGYLYPWTQDKTSKGFIQLAFKQVLCGFKGF